MFPTAALLQGPLHNCPWRWARLPTIMRDQAVLAFCTIVSVSVVNTVPPPQNCSIEAPSALDAPTIHVATLIAPDDEHKEMEHV